MARCSDLAQSFFGTAQRLFEHLRRRTLAGFTPTAGFIPTRLRRFVLVRFGCRRTWPRGFTLRASQAWATRFSRWIYGRAEAWSLSLATSWTFQTCRRASQPTTFSMFIRTRVASVRSARVIAAVQSSDGFTFCHMTRPNQTLPVCRRTVRETLLATVAADRAFPAAVAAPGRWAATFHHV